MIYISLILLLLLGIDLYLTRTFGRSKKGFKCYRNISNHKGKHVSVMMAVSSELPSPFARNLVGGVRKEHFFQFVKDLCDGLESTITESENFLPFCLVFDNCPAHSGIEEVVASYSNCFAKRLPPYSPELNVIEFMFSPFKAEIKRRLRQLGPVELWALPNETLASCRSRILQQVANESVPVITQVKVFNAFRHVCLTVVPKALAREDL